MTIQRNFELSRISVLQQQLNQHPVYAALQTVADLQCFMQHHVYSVWDFMSLIKYLQQQVAPIECPWRPQGDPSVRRFINELVLEEESDEVPNGTHGSHFELYCLAMQEVGADTRTVLRFIELLATQPVTTALNNAAVPMAAQAFTSTTFAFIDSQQAHRVAAALALGREHIIPSMFRAFLQRMNITEQQAPIFHYYLKRHIALDEDFHAPLSMRLLMHFCHSEALLQEAEQAAIIALQARYQFWDGVLAVLPSQTKL